MLVANILKVANRQPKQVANISAGGVSRHGKYADLSRRRQYMRDYMRTYRAKPGQTAGK